MPPENEEEKEEEVVDEDNDAELLALATRLDTVEAENARLSTELERAHARCQALEDTLQHGDSTPASIHFWAKKIGV